MEMSMLWLYRRKLPKQALTGLATVFYSKYRPGYVIAQVARQSRFSATKTFRLLHTRYDDSKGPNQ